MANGIIKNAQVVLGQIRESGRTWLEDITDTWRRIGEAVDNREWSDLVHLFLAAAGDTLRFFLRLDRLWLYVFVAWLASLTPLYSWPLQVTWTGF